MHFRSFQLEMVGDIDAQNSSVNVFDKDIFSKVDIIFTI